MAILKLCGFVLLASLALTVFGAEKPIQPVAYFIDTLPIDVETETPESHASFIRDGASYPAFEGMEVYPGDVISTPAGGGILIAFLNNSTVQLHESSKLTIEEPTVAAVDLGTPVTINLGHVFVQMRSSETDSLAIGFGNIHTDIARVTSTASKPAKLDIIVTGTAPNYVTNVGVLAGTVTLTPRGSNKVDLSSGTLSLLTFNTPVAGVSGSPVTINTVNLSKTQLAALKLGSISETFATVGKSGSVSFKSTIHNPDGSISKGSFTTLNGIVTKDAWSTKGLNKFSESWKEAAGKISVKQSFDGNSFSASFLANASSKATVKVGKLSYAGTATYDPTTGIMTFTTVKKAKDGSSVSFTFKPDGLGGSTQTIVVTSSTGVAGTPVTHVLAAGAPPANTPDFRGVTQNQVPVSH